MSERKLVLIREIIVTQLNHWVTFILVFTAASVTDLVKKPDFLSTLCIRWTIAGLLPLYFYYLRKTISANIPAVLLHFAGCVAMVFIPIDYPQYQVIFGVCSVFYLVLSLKRFFEMNFEEDKPASPVLAIVFFVFSFGVFSYLETECAGVYKILILTLLAGYLIQLYLERYISFMELTKINSGISGTEGAFSAGISLVTGFTVLSVIVLAFSTDFEWMEKAVNFVVGILKRGMTFLLSLFAGLFGEEPIAEISTEQEEIIEQAQNVGDFSSPVLQVLFYIGSVFALIFIAGGIFFWIIRMVNAIRCFILGRQEKNTIEERDYTEIHDKVNKAAKKSSDDGRHFWALSYSERIRKIFKAKVLNEKRTICGNASSQLLGRYTARECVNAIPNNSEEMDYSFSELYEKVRYSDEKIEAEDLKQMKRAAAVLGKK